MSLSTRLAYWLSSQSAELSRLLAQAESRAEEATAERDQLRRELTMASEEADGLREEIAALEHQRDKVTRQLELAGEENRILAALNELNLARVQAQESRAHLERAKAEAGIGQFGEGEEEPGP